MSSPKIIDVISKKKEDGTPYISLEYFPPRSAEGTVVSATVHVRFSGLTEKS